MSAEGEGDRRGPYQAIQGGALRQKNFLQKYGVELEGPFVRVAKFASIQIILRYRGALQARAAPQRLLKAALLDVCSKRRSSTSAKEEIHLMKQPDEIVKSPSLSTT